MVATHDDAHRSVASFVQTCEPRYPKAVECLANDRDAPLIIYDIPAVHWIHLRTADLTESTFATVRLRTARRRGCDSRTTVRSTAFKLAQSAEQRWRQSEWTEIDPVKKACLVR